MVLNVEELLNQKKELSDKIHESQLKLIQYKADKRVAKAPLWKSAEGTVDAKKDWINAELNDYITKIEKEENNIERYRRELSIIDDKLEYLTNV